MTDEDTISVKDLPADVVQAGGADHRGRVRMPADGIDLDKEMEAYERKWVETALDQGKHVKAEAARLLGVDKNRMNYLCRKYRL